MISLDFDTNEKQNAIDVHKWDKNIVLVAHNGYSYVRVVIPQENLDELINKLQKHQNDEAESV
jgi:hypothetical protein